MQRLSMLIAAGETAAMVLTSDPDDLRHLSNWLRTQVAVRAL